MMRKWKDYVLDPFQREALAAIEAGESVIVAAPTGAGKTLVAEYAFERALAEGRRIIYTAPIKALSNQKFRDLGALYGDRVGIMTGDVTIHPSAQALIMTTEIFRNTIFDNPARLQGIQYVILDEAHYLDDPERGTVWEESIIFAPPAIRFICLSATISNLDEFAAWFRKVRQGPLRVVLEERRPVPLHPFIFTGDEAVELKDLGRWARERSRHRHGGRRGRSFAARAGGGGGASASFMRQNLALVDLLAERDHLPAIFFLFSRDFCERMASAAANRTLVTPEEGEELARRVDALERDLDLADDPGAARLRRLLVRGIAYHHAGMLPTLKEVVERLFTSGCLKLLFATETFALGVNMPARAVAFESLKKFDGVKRAYMKTREFLQMAGRAGRRGIDREGFVYACMQPEREQAGDLRAVILGDVEEVESQFNLSYATLLHLYAHLGEQIYEACEKSFVHFRHKRRKGGPFADMLGQVKRRLGLLEELGYLEGRKLTPKGKFASLIYGYEIQAAELYFGGLLPELEVPEMCVLLAACVYEAKRDTWSVPLVRQVLEPIRRRARDLIEPVLEQEETLGIRYGTRPLDFSLARATWEWVRGAPFEALREYADLAAGDAIRVFRLTIQLLRQLLKPLRFLPGDTSAFRRKVLDAMGCLKRDVVDAERQLRQSVRLEGGDEALAKIPREEADEGAEGEPSLEHVLAPPSPGPGEVELFLGESAPAFVPEAEAAIPEAEADADADAASRERAIEHAPSDLDALEIFDLDREEREARGHEAREKARAAGERSEVAAASAAFADAAAERVREAERRLIEARARSEAAEARVQDARGEGTGRPDREPGPRRRSKAQDADLDAEPPMTHPPPGTLDALRAAPPDRYPRSGRTARNVRGAGEARPSKQGRGRGRGRDREVDGERPRGRDAERPGLGRDARDRWGSGGSRDAETARGGDGERAGLRGARASQDDEDARPRGRRGRKHTGPGGRRARGIGKGRGGGRSGLPRGKRRGRGRHRRSRG